MEFRILLIVIQTVLKNIDRFKLQLHMRLFYCKNTET